MKKVLFITAILLYVLACRAQPTFFGAVSNVADNVASSTTPTTITPPASMLAGDLVILFSITRTTAATNAISATGGQTWTPLTAGGTTDQTTRIFWARFDGSWTTDPSVSFSTALACNVFMIVFRPTVSAYTWAIDQAVVNTPVGVPGGPPYTVSITGLTNTQPNNVTVAFFASTDDNSWITPTGSFTAPLTPIYRRNPSGNDQSYVPYYRRLVGAGATGNLTLDQSAAAPDAGSTAIVSFYQVPTPGGTYKGMPLNMVVQ